VFLFVSFFIVFLGFEFLGLIFATVYVGGIIVMFLFLILIVDVRVENTQKLIFKNKDFFFTLFFSIFFTLFFSIFFIYNYCPTLGNTFHFYKFFNDAKICPTACTEDFYLNLDEIQLAGIDTTKDLIINKFFSFEYILDNFSDNLDFDEIYMLGVIFPEQHGLLLCLIGLFLLIATIVAVILCLNIFN
jgi:NADH:ubiquinone oxidoreductase subunit 6 (subunit J)